MGVFDDYINGLDGKDDLDPAEIVKNLSELHNTEMSDFRTKEYDPVVAKVNQLNETVQTKDQEIVNAQKEIDAQKARNFDLATQIPGFQGNVPDPGNNEITGATITPDDLFER